MSVEAPLKQIVLKPGKRSREVTEFEERLRNRIIGQDEAVSQLVNVYQTIRAGMTGPGRPLANLLFLGPTGSGKPGSSKPRQITPPQTSPVISSLMPTVQFASCA